MVARKKPDDTGVDSLPGPVERRMIVGLFVCFTRTYRAKTIEQTLWDGIEGKSKVPMWTDDKCRCR
jgi:hypothetical protein